MAQMRGTRDMEIELKEFGPEVKIRVAVGGGYFVTTPYSAEILPTFAAVIEFLAKFFSRKASGA